MAVFCLKSTHRLLCAITASFPKHSSFHLIVLFLLGVCVVVYFQARGFHHIQLEQQNKKSIKPSSSHNKAALPQTDHLFERLGIEVKPWNTQGHAFPCIPPEKEDWLDSNVRKTPTRQGLLFVESSKTDSTTGTSISLRMAFTFRKGNICQVRFSHNTALQMKYAQRNAQRSFLWSMVRNPTDRAVSEFLHYQVSWRKASPTLNKFVTYSHDSRRYNKQLKTLALTKYETGKHALKEILQNYNFLGVTDRMDESAVALQMMLGLQLSNVMYLPNDDSKDEYDSGSHRKQCWLIHKNDILSQQVKDYLQSSEWNDFVYWDGMLYQAANRALDMTIDKLGRDQFQQNLEKFRKVQQELGKYCSSRVVLPCNSTGPPLPEEQTDCIVRDSGCGFDCMDDFFRQWDK